MSYGLWQNNATWHASMQLGDNIALFEEWVGDAIAILRSRYDDESISDNDIIELLVPSLSDWFYSDVIEYDSLTESQRLYLDTDVKFDVLAEGFLSDCLAYEEFRKQVEDAEEKEWLGHS